MGRKNFLICIIYINTSYVLHRIFLGFDRYKGGLDTVHDLTGLYSIFTRWRSIEIMFHVSTHLPNDPNDHQKVIFILSISITF